MARFLTALCLLESHNCSGERQTHAMDIFRHVHTSSTVHLQTNVHMEECGCFVSSSDSAVQLRRRP